MLGVRLDETQDTRDAERIAATDAKVAVLVVPAGEEIGIARQTARVPAPR